MTKLDELKRASVRPSDLLAAAAAIAAGTQAYGEVVIFINPEAGEPGHFDWTFGPDEGPPGTPAQWLDITLPSTDQGGGVGPSSVGQLHSFIGGYGGTRQRNYTSSGASVAASPHFTLGLDAAAVVDGSWSFSNYAVHIYHSKPTAYGVPNYTITHFPSSVASYMGVRFNDVDGYHYGWISVARNFLDFDAFAWGYETEPGVPIIAGIPAPGTLAALAFGAAVTRRGRKREGS
jgi:hypothetical protein